MADKTIESVKNIEKLKSTFEGVQKELGKVIVGQKQVVEQILVSILANGNALLESAPGLGKTTMINTLANILDMSFNRIQCTPDLMPTDITGTYVIEEEKGKKVFKFHKGPIFANIVLTDEINRATPKTQSALLEAMQEKQVSVGNQTFPLDKPFFVLATQNPIDQEGSLALDQPVLFNGSLKTGSELIELAGEKLVDTDYGAVVYSLGDAFTQGVNSDGKVEEKQCLLYTLPYSGKMYKLATSTGRGLTVTANHPLLVNNKGIVSWKKAENLEKDDYLVCPARLEQSFSKVELMHHDEVMENLAKEFKIVRKQDIALLRERSKNFSEFASFKGKDFDILRIALKKTKKDIAKDLGLDRKCYWQLVRFLSRSTNNNYIKNKVARYFLGREIIEADFVESWKAIRINKVSGPELFEFLGLLLSEGSISKNHISFYQKNYKEFIDKFTQVLDSFGVDYTTRDMNGCLEVKVVSKPLVRYLEMRFGLSESVPDWLISLPEDYRRAFLRGFLIPESHVGTKERRITFSQKSQDSVNVVSYLLRQEGIHHTIKDSGIIFRIKIQGADVGKALRILKWPTFNLDCEETSRHRVIPVDKEKINLALASMKETSKRPWYNSLKSVKRKGVMARYMCNSMMTDMSNEFIGDQNTVLVNPISTKVLKYLETLASEDLSYEKVEVVDIFDYDGLVYGLTVPEGHNYIAGFGALGFNHNTYPLPEAQTDRFLLKILVDYPPMAEELEIVNRYTSAETDPGVKTLLSKQSLTLLQKLTRQVPIADDLKKIVVEIVNKTRNLPDLIEYGASPRASIGLILAAKAKALLEGRKYVSAKDIEAMAYPVLRHRIILSFKAEREGMSPDDVIARLLK